MCQRNVMKKNFIKDNIWVLSGIFIAGVVLATITTPIFSRNQNQVMQDNNETVEYGPQGYGRGSGNGSEKNTSQTSQVGLNKENCLMDGCLLVDDAEYPVGELSGETIEYLQAAIADERKALATYEAVIAKFGNVKPFINIIRAEEQHISMLKALFDKYDIEIPADKTTVGVLPATLAEVCAVGVQAEIDNDQLYQDMIPAIEEQDIKDIFNALADASRNMHLPAFERCAN